MNSRIALVDEGEGCIREDDRLLTGPECHLGMIVEVEIDHGRVDRPTNPISQCQIRPHLILVLRIGIKLLRLVVLLATARLCIKSRNPEQKVSPGVACTVRTACREGKLAAVLGQERVPQQPSAHVEPELQCVAPLYQGEVVNTLVVLIDSGLGTKFGETES